MTRKTIDKSFGAVYTPSDIVKEVLDAARYIPELCDLSTKTILEPSCGDGAFLVEIANRLVESILMRTPNMDIDKACKKITTALSTCIMAIEIDTDEIEKAKQNVIDTLKRRYGYDAICGTDIFRHWHTGDAIDYLSNDKTRYDFIVGNPPYVRIHNVCNSNMLRKMQWCSNGMTDMFYAFYELGFNHLNKNGILAYIASSTWMMAKSGMQMRERLRLGGNIKEVIDHGNNQLFKGITAYVATVVLTEKRNEYIEYSSPTEQFAITQSDAWINGKFMPIADNETRTGLDEITSGLMSDDTVRIGTGFQTGNDTIFLDTDKRFPNKMKIKVVKASTGATQTMFFPYDEHGQLMPLDVVNAACIDEGKNPLDDIKNDMINRSGINESNWWGFARTQAISAVYVDKVTISNLFIPGKIGKLVHAPAGTGVYGCGCYLTGMTIDEVRSALSCRWFDAYVKAFGRRKRGGYFALNGSDLLMYFRWYKYRIENRKQQ